jgi:Fe-S-cluster-containing dehydrogenase component
MRQLPEVGIIILPNGADNRGNHNMIEQRRNFIKRSLVVLGAAAAGGGIIRKLATVAEAADATSSASPISLPILTIRPTSNVKTGCACGVKSDQEIRQGVPGKKWVMVFDLAKCDGCGKCTQACSKMHFVPPDRQWIKVLKMQDADTTAPYYFPQPCYHCDNPPCTKVCPVDATFKRQDGVVLIDNDRCIGCRFCMAACPYGARSFNWGHPDDPPDAAAQSYSPEWGYPRKVGTVEKCDFCPEMAEQGLLPACTSGCPMGAIYYGDENEDAVTNSAGETLRFKQLLLDRSGYRQMEELGTRPRVYYLPPNNRMYAPPAPQKIG